MNKMHGRIKRTYRCCVIEDGSQCDMYFDAYMSPAELNEIGNSRYICKSHLAVGYSWLSEIMGDKDVTVDDLAHYEMVNGSMRWVGDEKIGTRNPELYTRPTDIANKTGVRSQDLTSAQAATSSKGKQVLRGYGVVQRFDDDSLVLPLDETTDPDSPTVKRKLKLTVGFATKPKPKQDDVF